MSLHSVGHSSVFGLSVEGIEQLLEAGEVFETNHSFIGMKRYELFKAFDESKGKESVPYDRNSCLVAFARHG